MENIQNEDLITIQIIKIIESLNFSKEELANMLAVVALMQFGDKRSVAEYLLKAYELHKQPVIH